jgi:membrane protein YqaA with SNARE-associated domain
MGALESSAEGATPHSSALEHSAPSSLAAHGDQTQSHAASTGALLEQSGESGSAVAAAVLPPADTPPLVALGAPAEGEQSGAGRQRFLSVSILVVTIAGSIWLALNPEWILAMGSWGYAGAFAISLASSASVILPVPGLPVAMALGTALNPFLLGIVTGIASALGELTGYALGRSGGFLIAGDQERTYRRLVAWTERRGSLAVFIVALLPIPFFDLAGIAAGAMRMPVSSFLVATALGKTIKYTIAILLTAGWFAGMQRWFQ